jgi:type IV pilus assembly protein PilC
MPTPFLILVLSVFLLPLVGGLGYLAYYLFSLPMRRHERAALFLDLLEHGLQQGRTLEHTVQALDSSGDQSLGKPFRRLAAAVREGLSLDQALQQAPGVLPAPVQAMLQAGRETGDWTQALPPCRDHLKDAVTKTWMAHHYLMLLAFVLTPAWIVISCLLLVFVVPKFQQIALDMGADTTGLFQFLVDYFHVLVFVQGGLLVAFYAAALLYLSGPRLSALVARRLPGLRDWLAFKTPWRRKRLQRDFSAMLALLLDARVPEPRALTLAAQSTANRILKTRAAGVVEDLGRGVRLPDAVSRLDETGEFRWRLSNAARAGRGFLAALAGWHEALEASAYQQEQTAAQLLTTALLLVNGLFVGLLAITVFQLLLYVTQVSPLW